MPLMPCRHYAKRFDDATHAAISQCLIRLAAIISMPNITRIRAFVPLPPFAMLVYDAARYDTIFCLFTRSFCPPSLFFMLRLCRFLRLRALMPLADAASVIDDACSHFRDDALATPLMLHVTRGVSSPFTLRHAARRRHVSPLPYLLMPIFAAAVSLRSVSCHLPLFTAAAFRRCC